MSTRSVIGWPEGDGFAGRYHHNDGDPSGVGRVLLRMVDQYSVDEVVTMLRTEKVGFSAIYTDDGSPCDPTAPAEWPEYGFDCVGPKTYSAREDDARYAEQENDDPDFGGQVHRFTDDDSFDTEWAYAVSPGGIGVWKAHWGKSPAWETVGLVRYSIGLASGEIEMVKIEERVMA